MKILFLKLVVFIQLVTIHICQASEDINRDLGTEHNAAIYVINRSGYKMEFFLSDKEIWRPYFLENGKDFALPVGNRHLLIQTSNNDVDPLPSVPTPEVKIASKIDGINYIVTLSAKHRWQFCWNNERHLWVVDTYNGPLCR